MTLDINSQDWQQNFISTNLIAIGYNAWLGYSNGERGIVICSTNSPHLGVSGETFKAHFVPRQNLAPFLNAWLAAPDTILLQRHFMNGDILQAVDSYNPEKDAVFLLEYRNQVAFCYLTNLPITPPQCFQTVRKQLVEFQSTFKSFQA
ncbi:MAG: hypothetical protein HC836_11930 [Richelia sp. RM2_1_2]|nr:hypothetical protein [Richelia sp. SM1_7_0]NJN09332.1 hypothetical protein [Richelia sp. RM1_1_1]NJO28405.1 hypothetical protein [Richelia sp. SL_2_1]NJO59013.1 hypothetical protein [Richelia sp. RM2_1_2]